MDNIRTLASHFERAFVIENPHPALDEALERQGISVARLSDSQVKAPQYVTQRLRDYAMRSEWTYRSITGAATEDAQPRIAEHVAASVELLNARGGVRDTVYSPRVSFGLDAQPEYWALAVVHSDARGTTKALSDVIFVAGLNNIESTHRDFLFLAAGSPTISALWTGHSMRIPCNAW